MKTYSAGIDVAEAGCHAVVLGDDGTVIKRASAGGDRALAPVLKNVAAHAAVIGVAVDPTRQESVTSALTGKPVAGKSIHVCSPGAAAVTAEALAGAAQGARDAICLWIGERVFAGVMLAGAPLAGSHGLAGAAAWLALNPVERQDYRKFGSLAAEVSNTGIARRLSWRIQSGDRSAVLDRVRDLDAITASDVFDGARAGDGVSISVVRETARYIGMAMANLVSMLDPEVVVLGGDIASAGDLLLEPVAQECSRRLPPAAVPLFRLRLSSLGMDAVAIGAARLAATARR